MPVDSVVEAIVAGHICLDVIPDWPTDKSDFRLMPGRLEEIGPARITPGGCVSNTGRALHQLGVPTRLVAKVGDDVFGRAVQSLLGVVDTDLAAGITTSPDLHTSYSIILSPAGVDRMVLHFPGSNDTFTAADISADALAGARLFHFGYPPLMRRMYEDNGANLAGVMRRAKEAGLTTSLDMAYPDPATAAAGAEWRRILTMVLPSVDVFLPSLEEILLMLYPQIWERLAARHASILGAISDDFISSLGAELVGMGAAIVGIKLGERGFYLRSAHEERLRSAGPGLPRHLQAWQGREIWSAPFKANTVGTAGAGDAAVGGLLLGLLAGMSPEDAVSAACAVGAASTEAADPISAIASWQATSERIGAGWERENSMPGDRWLAGDRRGLWLGPSDARRRDFAHA